MITEEQLPAIKKQLIEEIDKKFPNDKKEIAKEQVESMNKEELTNFLKENGLIKEEKSDCVFCLISEGKISSTKIEEDEFALAILELNPISSGHTLIIPKKHISSPEEIPKEIKDFSEKIISKLKNLNPKNIIVKSDNITGHEIINLIPIYDEENEKSQRKKATVEELNETLKKIIQKEKITEKCLFCKIGSKEISSKKIEENEYAIAVLEINPISSGHTLIIPKKHIKNSGELPFQALSLAKKISKRIKTKLKPKEVIIYTENKFGHEVITVLPIYNQETKNSSRLNVEEKELDKNLEKLFVKEKIKEQEEIKQKEAPKEDLSNFPKFPTRIP